MREARVCGLRIGTYLLGLCGLSVAYSFVHPQTQEPFANIEFSRGISGPPRMLLIAHRGGVVTPSARECSRTALLLALENGYDMIELDLRQSQDGVPMVFHDRSLTRATGHDGSVESTTSEVLRKMRFLGTEDTLMTFEDAVHLMRGRAGIMLDFKEREHQTVFYETILRVLEETEMLPYTVAFPSYPGVKEHFFGRIRLQIEYDRVDEVLELSPEQARHYFLFGLPAALKKLRTGELRSRGVPIIAAINTFRYPAEDHHELARREVQEMLEWGVDGFQIDSVYEEMVREAIQSRSSDR